MPAGTASSWQRLRLVGGARSRILPRFPEGENKAKTRGEGAPEESNRAARQAAKVWGGRHRGIVELSEGG